MGDRLLTTQPPRSIPALLAELLMSVVWAAISIVIAGSPLWIALARKVATFPELVVSGKVAPVTVGLAASSAVMALSNWKKWRNGFVGVGLSLFTAVDVVVIVFVNGIQNPTAADADWAKYLLVWAVASVAGTRFVVTVENGGRQ